MSQGMGEVTDRFSDDMAHLRRRDYFAKTIDLAVARDLIQKYHYAGGGSNTRVFTHGLFHIERPDEALGVAWWIPPTKSAALSVNTQLARGTKPHAISHSPRHADQRRKFPLGPLDEAD